MSNGVDTGWETVYRDNADWIYRLVFAKVGNKPDAEDLTAEVFLAAFGSMRTSAEPPQIRAYLAATARTVLAGHWRRTFGRQINEIDLIALAEPRADDIADTERTAKRADLIIAELPERYRRILQLRFLDAYSLKEAAAELGVTVGNAKVLQHRALRLAAQAAHRLQEGSA
ncbi:MAG TPA: sigma-70 family RNA polymerase sigma factor [Pseudonocardiaceae bacterium]|nr:sigma-70 family RNA polymerase sigma factor [Pseudonocardiaceae bacterium]